MSALTSAGYPVKGQNTTPIDVKGSNKTSEDEEGITTFEPLFLYLYHR